MVSRALPFVPLLLLLTTLSNGASLIKINQDEGSSKRVEQLDDNGKVLMAWEVDLVKEEITFEIEAETTGYVGFGISPQGSMTGADIFIAGVNLDGSTYHSDRFGVGFSEPKIDNHSDWTLLDAKEFVGISSVTYLKFSRRLNTCDDEDYPITEGTNRLIWALGSKDVIEYHSTDRRGARSVNLLGAPMPPLDSDGMLKYDFTVDMVMPQIDTAYWCTFHKGPLLNKKYHVIGFEAMLPSAASLKHTHHFAIYNCYNSPDSDQPIEEIFQNFTIDKYDGDHCFGESESEITPPLQYCTELVYVWAKGGRQMAFPEGVGYPIGPEGSETGPLQQYYMLEIHYDNPEVLEEEKFETGLQMIYTDQLRDIEAGMLLVLQDTVPTLTVPPHSEAFVITGHCSPSCSDHFPTEGITIFNSLLHSHLSGKQIKVRHFREDQELEWLDNDDHYDFNYQQNKPLVSPRKVRPGDQLSIECIYDTRWKNNSVVIGGLTTRDEMCQAFMWYYPKMNINLCGSLYPFDEGFKEFGITKYDLVPTPTGQHKVLILEPLSLAGDYETVLNTNFNWTPQFETELQEKRRFENHETLCIVMKTGEHLTQGQFIKYPSQFQPYLPEDVCSRQEPQTTPQGGGGSGGESLKSWAIFVAVSVLVKVL